MSEYHGTREQLLNALGETAKRQRTNEMRAVVEAAREEIKALLAEREALREFYAAAVADGAEDVPGAPDDESIGWVGDRDMVMTYGHIRRAAPSVAKGETE